MPVSFVVMQFLALAVPVGALGFFGWLALRFVRAKERDAGRIDTVRPDDLSRIQDAMLALQSEVAQIRERQEFVEKLLERPRSPQEIPGQSSGREE